MSYRNYIFVTTRNLDPRTFLNGLFENNYSLAMNSLVPITVQPEYLKLDEFKQSSKNVLEVYEKLDDWYWSSALGPSALGQFTARKQINLFALARSDIRFRAATTEEIHHDFQILSEEVTGPEYTGEIELKETQSTFQINDTTYFYTGPARFSSATLTARVVARSGFPDEDELAVFRKEIDENHGEPKNSIFQFYLAIAAEKAGKGSAKIHCARFGRTNGFDPKEIQYLGSVEVMEESGRLLFHPEDNREKSIDFSINFWTE